MRLAIASLLAAALTAACSPSKPSRPLPATSAKPHVSATVDLPNGDGRVHVIKDPDALGVEVTTCFVLAGASGAQGIACAPPRIELPAVSDDR